MIIKRTYRLLSICILLLLSSVTGQVFGQVLPSDLRYPANHLNWFTISGNHFDIHFQEGNEESALAVSAIADEVYAPITDFYNHTLTKSTSIILRDREDYSNGAAYFYDNKIEIFLPAIDIRLRGTHNWLRNVITHEFTHIVQLDAAKQGRRSIPAIYFQWLSYEDARRPDILYGFPNGILTFPFSNLSMPAWFAEGVAQYQHRDLNFDFWDTHRDMVLRTRIETDTYLSLDEMSNFSSKNSLERELIYNQGFALVNYLAVRFGEEVLPALTRESATGRGKFNSVLERVTGYRSEELFSDWITYEKKTNRSAFAHHQYTETIPVERSGFYNFYPRHSPDGEWFAYLSNRGYPHGDTRLIIQKTNGDTSEYSLMPNSTAGKPGTAACYYHIENRSRIRSDSRFSFSPQNNQIAFSRAKRNKYGEEYNDLYLFNPETETTTQITRNKRIFDIDWHPSEKKVAGVIIEDGKQNVVIIHTGNGEVQRLTDFPFGTSVYTPVWDSAQESIIFSAANRGSRNLYRADMNGNTEPILIDEKVDFRDPAINHQTGTLYFSADYDGIFNIYRFTGNESAIEQLTSVPGGAFMPSVFDDEIYFSEYHADGYKISKIAYHPDSVYTSRPADPPVYSPLEVSDFSLRTSDVKHLRDTDPPVIFTYQLHDDDAEPKTYERVIEPYSEQVTPLNIYPVIRFDNYTKLRGGNARLLAKRNFADLGENLWRDMKIGAYFSSRDVTESLSLFGGVLIGPGSNPESQFSSFFSPSRLLDADRDIFFTVDYSGLPLIKRSWSPTISFEFANMVRNVSGGLEVEEFPCTSCLPETKNIDIRYMVWEAGLFLRSKLNRWSLIETGVLYSPYRVKTDGFFSEEYNESIPGSSSEYFRGFSLTAAHISDLTLPDIHSDIAPKGVRAELRYRYEPGKLLRGFEIEDGTLSPFHETEKNHSVELKSRIGFSAGEASVVQFTSRFFTFFNHPEDYFYMDYSGGLSGLRSYPFFAIGGQRTFFIRSSFLTPLLTDINRNAGPLMLDKIFAHIYAETGNGYGGPLSNSKKLKNGIGAELRFSLNSYYLFPLKFFINGSYGFNQFDINLPANFNHSTDKNNVNYGREILFYFGLTFDFDFL